MVEKDPRSPRLKQLSGDLARGDEAALDLFWQEVQQEGTPLIEPDGKRRDFSLVTFLWRAAVETKNVVVQIAVNGTGQDVHAMNRLPQTDLWYATFCLRNDFRGAYKFSITDEQGQDSERHDPFNPNTFVEPKDETRPDHTEDDIDSVVRLPDAPEPFWTTPRRGIARGTVAQHLFRSQILKNERRVWIYTPPTGTPPAGCLVVLDGRFFNFAVRVPMILDNLLAEGAVQPLVAVLVDNPGQTWQEAMAIRERELACHAPFADFLAQELLTWLRQTWGLTAAPAQTTVAGGSLGGLAAAFVAMQYPAMFGSVLAMSGSFWWRPDGADEWEWLTRQVAMRPLASLRVYLEVGLLESRPSAGGFPGQLLANRHLRDVCQAKGYDLFYAEHMHGHDATVWPDVLGKGLLALSRT